MAKRRRLTAPKPEFFETEAAAPRADRKPALPPIAQVAGDSAATAALGELSATLQAARDEGRLIQSLAPEDIDAGHLVRDRLVAEEDDLQVLETSLRARGQQTPVEVVDRGPEAAPRYGLISGWRRLTALRRIARDVPQTRVLALVRAPRGASEAYVAMVEENEIRVGLSYYERGRIVEEAVTQGVFPDRRRALQALFANVSRAKRSKIGSFAAIAAALDGTLRFPTALGERLGLDLARYLAEDPARIPALRSALSAAPAATADEEQARLAAAMAPVPSAGSGETGQEPADPAAQASEGRGADPAPASDVPAQSKAVRSPVAIVYDPAQGRLVLSGPGVDADLQLALRRWLAARGQAPE